VYLRVSKDDGSQHLENQMPALLDMARARGLEVVETYADRASGAKLDRPELERLMQDASRARFGVVLVWAFDRLARDGTFLGGLRLVGELEEQYGCSVVSHEDRHLDTTGPYRRAILAIALRVAQDERERLRARTLAGLARARAAGRVGGRPAVTPIDPLDLEAMRTLRGQGVSWRGLSKAFPRYAVATIRRRLHGVPRGGCQNGAPNGSHKSANGAGFGGAA